MHRLKALAVSAVLGLAASGMTIASGVSTAGATVTKPQLRGHLATNVKPLTRTLRHRTLRSLSGVGGIADTSDEILKEQAEPGGGTPKHAALKTPTRSAAQTTIRTASAPTEFQGINHYQQAVGDRHTVTCPVPYNGGGYTCTATNFSFEPPDQMLCTGGTGGGTTTEGVLEGVNDSVALYGTDGTPVANTAMTLNDFFGLAPEATLVTSGGSLVAELFGSDIATDPRCMYDPATGRYTVLMLDLAADPSNGGYTGFTSLWFAESAPNDPTNWVAMGNFDLSFDGTVDCPCLGDQPLMGFNADAIYFSTNAYPFIPGGVGRGFFFDGAQLYVIDKTTLEAWIAGSAGSPTIAHADLGSGNGGFPAGPTYTQSNGGPCPYTDPNLGQVCLWYSTEPATTAPGVTEPSGSENLMSSGDFWGWQTGQHFLSGDNQVFTWQITGTDTYNASCATSCNFADLGLANDMTTVMDYALPPLEACSTGPDYNTINNCAHQKAAPSYYLPLALKCPSNLGTNAACAEAGIATNDQRMLQVMRDGSGHLWSALTTNFDFTQTTYQTAGVEWFEITPLVSGSSSSSLVHNGLTGNRSYDVFFPALAVGPNGHAVMGFDISGTGMYPGTGYQVLGDGSAPSAATIDYTSPRPEDGFAAYDPTYLRPRWGDYSGASVAPDGNIWFAGESTSIQRTRLADWSTEIRSIAAP